VVHQYPIYRHGDCLDDSSPEIVITIKKIYACTVYCPFEDIYMSLKRFIVEAVYGYHFQIPNKEGC